MCSWDLLISPPKGKRLPAYLIQYNPITSSRTEYALCIQPKVNGKWIVKETSTYVCLYIMFQKSILPGFSYFARLFIHKIGETNTSRGDIFRIADIKVCSKNIVCFIRIKYKWQLCSARFLWPQSGEITTQRCTSHKLHCVGSQSTALLSARRTRI